MVQPTAKTRTTPSCSLPTPPPNRPTAPPPHEPTTPPPQPPHEPTAPTAQADGNKTFSMHHSDLEHARTSFGTDEDMLFVFVPPRAARAGAGASGGAGGGGGAKGSVGSTSERITRGLQEDLSQIWGSVCSLGAGLMAGGEKQKQKGGSGGAPMRGGGPDGEAEAEAK